MDENTTATVESLIYRAELMARFSTPKYKTDREVLRSKLYNLAGQADGRDDELAGRLRGAADMLVSE